jgi:hypothetical protein
MSLKTSAYYLARPLIPRPVQIALRRALVRWQRPWHSEVWPIDTRNRRPPSGWDV